MLFFATFLFHHSVLTQSIESQMLRTKASKTRETNNNKNDGFFPLLFHIVVLAIVSIVTSERRNRIAVRDGKGFERTAT